MNYKLIVVLFALIQENVQGAKTQREVIDFLIGHGNGIIENTEKFLHEQRNLGNQNLLRLIEQDVVDLENLVIRLRKHALNPDNDASFHDLHEIEERLFHLENMIAEEVSKVLKETGQTLEPWLRDTTNAMFWTTTDDPWKHERSTTSEPTTFHWDTITEGKAQTTQQTTNYRTWETTTTYHPWTSHTEGTTAKFGYLQEQLIHSAEELVALATHIITHYKGPEKWKIEEEVQVIVQTLEEIEHFGSDDLLFRKLAEHQSSLSELLQKVTF